MRVFTYDTTLRDGEQCEGISLSLEDKILIARRLDEFGIDYIEGGFPASNPKDTAFFRELSENPLKHAKLAAFGNTCKKDVAAKDDAGLANIVNSGAPVATIVGKAWDAQVEKALLTSLDENLRMISDSVTFLKDNGLEVIFDAEHYFDGYMANPEYALECVKAANEAGADCVCLCETNGGMLPYQVEEIVSETCSSFPDQQFGIHCHNDSGCAVANSVAAIHSGVTHVQGTVNGLGERVGNTDLLTVIANVELKMGMDAIGDHNLRQLTEIAHYVAEITGVNVAAHYPYTGSSAFAHKGGLHASAIARFPQAYEHVSPERVGNSARMVVSELAGKASLVQKCASLGFDIADESIDIQEILDDIKNREAKGYTYEAADGSLALLVMRHLGIYEPAFTLESFRVIVDDREDVGALAKDAASEATVKIHVGDSRVVSTGEDKGPVGALANALSAAISEIYPQVRDMELVDFKVRLPEESQGTSALTRVTITTEDKFGMYGTVGVSENVIEAAWNALVESIEYGLVRFNDAKKEH